MVLPKTPERQQPSEDVDVLLHDFFQAEMPRRWPALPLPKAEGGHWLFQARSRFTLAASVAVLLIGSLWVAHSFPEKEEATFRPSPNTPTEAHRPGKHRLSTPPLGSAHDKAPRLLDDKRRH